ncbi:alpha-ketoglutarate-dependent dioxygenase [Pseudomonas oryzihabitans]|nr:alpha-ketoglutarate-dependent dioxygenase [Pseudomonas psychrotolerans]
MTRLDLFCETQSSIPLGNSAVLLRGFALAHISGLMKYLKDISARAPFRNMIAPNGSAMSVLSTNCGSLGWVSDRNGYRYSPLDPLTASPWPAMPVFFSQFAADSAATAGHNNFKADACLINKYVVGSKLSLHQDKNERNQSLPVVSISLGMDATFLLGGTLRCHPVLRIRVCHGDVVILCGEDRMRYHGILPICGPAHELLGQQRISLNFRKAG